MDKAAEEALRKIGGEVRLVTTLDGQPVFVIRIFRDKNLRDFLAGRGIREFPSREDADLNEIVRTFH